MSGAPPGAEPGAELDGKVAIVTGGGRGLGRAIAEAYLKAGARVVVTAAREAAELDAVVAPWGAERAVGTADAVLGDGPGRVAARRRHERQRAVLHGARGRAVDAGARTGARARRERRQREHELRDLTGHRLVATEWSPEHPDGRSASEGIGASPR